MSSTSVQISHTSSMGIYVPPQQCNIWREVAEGNNSSSPTDASTVLKIQTKQYVYPSHLHAELSDNDQHSSWLTGRIQKRLAQNREAAKKSRLKKKAYVQELEISRLKLAQLEQELEQVKRNQGRYVGNSLNSDSRAPPIRKINPGIAAFEIEYARWSEEQQRQKRQLQIAVEAKASDVDLRILVEDCLNHYDTLFLIKSENAKEDVFYLMSGLWRTPVERFFHWIGGYRPSEILDVIMPEIQPLSERQAAHVNKLKQSTLQAEYALSQGLEKLEQSLGEIMLGDGTSEEMQMILAMEKLEGIEGFVTQGDHLRKQSLQLMSGILMPSQAAMGLLALGDYFNRVSALSSLWEARPTKNRAIYIS